MVDAKEVRSCLLISASCDTAENDENGTDLAALAALDAPLEVRVLESDFGEGEFCDLSTGTDGSVADDRGKGA